MLLFPLISAANHHTKGKLMNRVLLKFDMFSSVDLYVVRLESERILLSPVEIFRRAMYPGTVYR